MFVPTYCSDCTFILKAKTNVTYIDVPTAKKPVSAWLNVQKGIFPNVSNKLIKKTKVFILKTIF